jgi:hypothetical protein
MPASAPLKFVALDREDLDVISAHLQDASVRVADVAWRPQDKRLVIGLDRLDWLSAQGDRPEFRRCRAALRFDRVLACRCNNLLDPANRATMLNLLAVLFDPGDEPGGTVRLTFTGGGEVRLAVECLEIELTDLGPSWTNGPQAEATASPAP